MAVKTETAIMAAGRGALRVNAPRTALAPAAAKVLPASIDELPGASRAVALERLTFVRLVQARKRCARCNDREAALWVGLNHVEEFPRLREGGKHQSSALTYSNYRNWKSRIAGLTDDNAILLQLCDSYRRGLQKRRGDERFWQLFFALYLNRNRLPLTVAYDNACRRMRTEDKNSVVPSIAQVRYQVDHLDPDQLILSREGEEVWRNKCCDFIRRDWRDVAPGECIIGDSRTFDTRVRVWDEAHQRWIAVRPTIAGLLDARSWFLPAYWITTTPVNSDTLIDTLRLYLHATEGVAPAIVYFDNGKDYCAQGFATDFDAEGHQHSIFRELGIRLLNSLAYNGRAKTIERAFRDMMQNFDKLFPDYLGSRPGQRTLAADYYDRHPEELPSMQQFCQIFAAWLNDYHHKPKAGEIHRGQSPAEIWAHRSANGRVQHTSERLKMAFLKPVAVRTVGRGPAVKFDNTFYYSDRLTWGKKVLIKSDTLNPDHVYCFTPEGALIGEAVTRNQIHALAGDRQAIAALMSRQRRQLKEARTALADLTGGQHIYSPLELLLAAPDAPTITTGTIASVKGSAHRFTNRQIAGVITPPETPQAIEYQEAPTVDPELLKVNAILTRQVTAPDDPDAAFDAEDLARVHAIIKKTKGDEDNEY